MIWGYPYFRETLISLTNNGHNCSFNLKLSNGMFIGITNRETKKSDLKNLYRQFFKILKLFWISVFCSCLETLDTAIFGHNYSFNLKQSISGVDFREKTQESLMCIQEIHGNPLFSCWSSLERGNSPKPKPVASEMPTLARAKPTFAWSRLPFSVRRGSRNQFWNMSIEQCSKSLYHSKKKKAGL